MALKDLLGILRENRLAFLKAYFDESMSHHTANPSLLVVGGCTMSSESWTELSAHWQNVLNSKEFQIEMYRSSDCNASKGQFLGWDGAKKDRLRTQLIEVLNNIWRGKPVAICPVFNWCILDTKVFDRILNKFPQLKLTPYEFCVAQIANGCVYAIREVAKVAKVEDNHTLGLFFEEGQNVRPHVRKLLRETRQLDARIVDISFVSKGDHIPLQVADMIAFEAFKSHFEGTRKVLLDLIDSGIGGPSEFDEPILRELLEGYALYWSQ